MQIAAEPQGLLDVLEAMRCYPLLALYGLLMDESTDCLFIVKLILYFVKLNGRLMVYM